MSEVQETNHETGERVAGILVPTFSIRTGDDLGIGDTEGVRQFIDLAADLGFGFLQLLPINEIGPDNSPYNAISSVALEPLTIDCRPGAGLPDLTEEAYREVLAKHPMERLREGRVNYGLVRALKRDLLERAFGEFKTFTLGQGTTRDREFRRFCDVEYDWLDDYCVYRFLMQLEGGNPNWQTWDESYRSLGAARDVINRSINGGNEWKAGYWILFYAYVQWVAWGQWKAVAAHGKSRGVRLMGDIPFGISVASADVFANAGIFDLEWYGGAPPETLFKDDPFVQKWGQNWGIPLYRWDVLAEQDYGWWRQRVRKTAEICEMFRIDHALGFYRIYSFPWNPVRNAEFLPLSGDEAAARCQGRRPGFRPRDDDSPENKEGNRRDGERYLRVLQEAAGGAEIIAEDLGTVPDYVRPSLERLGIAGIKVPQWEFEHGKVLAGGRYPHLSFACYTTHDHAPLKVQWNRSKDVIIGSEAGSDEWKEARHFISTLLEYCDISVTQFDELPRYDRNFLDALFWTLALSSSRYIAMMVTDLLYLEDRINVPGIMTDQNWTYRIEVTVDELRRGEKWEWMRDMSKNILKETGRTMKMKPGHVPSASNHE